MAKFPVKNQAGSRNEPRFIETEARGFWWKFCHFNRWAIFM